MSLSRRQLEELRPLVDSAVHKFLGFSEETLASAAINCIDRGYDSRKTEDKLRSILDDSQAMRFTDKLFDVYQQFKSMSKHEKSRKRREKEDEEEATTKPKKSRRFDDAPVPVNVNIPEPGQPSPGQLTADKIKEMMANAQKMIRERKAELNIKGKPEPPPQPASQPITSQKTLMSDAMEKAKKAAELQARIQAQLSNTGLGLGFGFGIPPPGAAGAGMPIPGGANAPKAVFMPTPVILDEEGRTIDVQTGQTIQLQHHMPTLKANIRAKRREQFKAVQEKAPEEIHESKFFDPRVSSKQGQRGRKLFNFNEPGKFEHLASRMRTKAQLDKLQNEIAQAAKKTGIASAAKLATIRPKKDALGDDVPDLEWWDSIILKADAYGDGVDVTTESIEGVTHLVEHPTQMRPPAEANKEVQIPVMLTKKERKKLRRQNRSEAQKELQEKIRLGLLPPPEPKVRMANLMRVLGTEAVQDPTKVEAHVRAQMAKRVRQHEEDNAARKLTKDQRREKKCNKLKEDTSLGVNVSVYRVRDLGSASHKFKVETNAKQLFMTGLVVLHKDCNVVVVEGGPKQNKKFRRLMLQRIKWGEDRKAVVKDDDSDSEEEDKRRVNACVLVWEGTVQTRAFADMRFKMCPTESFARETFNKLGVQHYWDLAFSGSVLEAAGED